MKKRVSFEQRQVLFNFMQCHEELAKGQLAGPDGARQKRQLLVELAHTLNSVAAGATKTPGKWLKCWQDWKSDVKTKYTRLKRINTESGSGSTTAPLTPLEVKLLRFFGIEMLESLPVHSSSIHVVPIVSSYPEQLSPAASSHIRPKLENSRSLYIGARHASKSSSTSAFQRREERKQKIIKRFGNLLKVEEDKIQLQRVRNNILIQKNNIAAEQVAALNRLTDALQGIVTNLINKQL